MTEENDTTNAPDADTNPAAEEEFVTYAGTEPAEETWVDRLMAEGADLSARLDKLNQFMDGEAYAALPKEDKNLLAAQQRCMTEYVNILIKRAARVDAGYFANPNAANVAATVDITDPPGGGTPNDDNPLA